MISPELSARLLAAAQRTAVARRAPLIAEMEGLSADGKRCNLCVGTCCTFVANSMRISPLETLDIAAHLEASGAAREEISARLAATVSRFGLDRPAPGDGQRGFSRRTYTCPFYAGGVHGCTLPRHAKPYGCLSFNPREANLTEGGACGSGAARPADVPLRPEEHAALAETAALLPADAIPLALTRWWQMSASQKP